VITKPREGEGHSPGWAAEPEKIIVIIIIIIGMERKSGQALSNKTNRTF
jgi:hypothetical protein